MSEKLHYSRLGGSGADFKAMIQRFGVVTVMNAKVYETSDFTLTGEDADAWENMQADAILEALNNATPLCTLDTLKVANATQEGPTKTVTGGQYSNPLIKFGKSMRLEMQDALGNAAALDALCGTVAEGDSAYSNRVDFYKNINALHVTEDFNGPKTIVGDSFFIEQKTGKQVKVKIIFYQFLPDSIFNLTQDAEGDATVFDMNGDLLTTTIQISDQAGNQDSHGVFYSIIDPTIVSASGSGLTLTATVGSALAVSGQVDGGTTKYSSDGGLTWSTSAPTVAANTTYNVKVEKNGVIVQSASITSGAE